MHLYRRQRHRLDCVVYGIAVMGVCGGIDDYSVAAVEITGVNAIYYFALAVALKEGYFRAYACRVTGNDVAQSVVTYAAVDTRLAYAEHIHIRSVNYLNLHRLPP